METFVAIVGSLMVLTLGVVKKIIVGPSVPVQRLEIVDRSELKSGAAVAAGAATNHHLIRHSVRKCGRVSNRNLRRRGGTMEALSQAR
jgi:hypothetical protein